MEWEILTIILILCSEYPGAKPIKEIRCSVGSTILIYREQNHRPSAFLTVDGTLTGIELHGEEQAETILLNCTSNKLEGTAFTSLEKVNDHDNLMKMWRNGSMHATLATQKDQIHVCQLYPPDG